MQQKGREAPSGTDLLRCYCAEFNSHAVTV